MEEKVSVLRKTVLSGRHTRQLLKDERELHYVGKSQRAGHLRRRRAGHQQHLLGCFHALDVQIFRQGLPRLEAEQVAEVGFAEVEFLGTFGSCGKLPALHPPRSNIVVHLTLQPCQQVFVFILTGENWRS